VKSTEKRTNPSGLWLAFTVAVARRDEKKAAFETLLDLHQQGINIPVERTKRVNDELAALEKAVAEVEAARDRANLSRPDVDVGAVSEVLNDIARMAPDEQSAARAAVREKLGRLVESVVLGPRGFVVHCKGGGKDGRPYDAKASFGQLSRPSK
jgi:hypothetical protein